MTQEEIQAMVDSVVVQQSETSASPLSDMQEAAENMEKYGAFMSGFRNRYADRGFRDSANDQMTAIAARNAYAGTPYEYMDKAAREDIAN